MKTTNRRQRLFVLFWAVAAALAVARGFINSLRPGRSIDLHAVYSWSSAWLWQGVNSYDPAPDLVASDAWWTMGANYPPYGIAFLSPIAMIPQGWVTLVWSIFNVALAIFVGILAFKIFNPKEPAKAALFPCLLFLSWVGLRVGFGVGQFSLLLMCFGLLAVAVTDKRPYLGGVLLGLALIKPQMGVAFFLWAIITRRFKPVAVSLAVMLLGVFLFSLRIGDSPIFLSWQFVNVLHQQFGGETFRPGVFELRPLVHFIINSFFVAEVLNLAIVLGLAGVIVLVALKSDFPDDGRRRDLVTLQLCCVWSLLAVFHNPYDSILMLPVMLGLYSYVKIARSPSAPSYARQARVAFWLLQAALVIEVAGRWRTLSKYFELSGYDLLGTLISHFDRVLFLGFFLFIAYGAGLSRLITRKSSRVREIAAA